MKDNPLVSLCILSYNQQDYIADAINGALSQTYDNLEIVISDDCSTDDTFSVAEKLVKDYKGPHKLILNRNEKNIGIMAHFNKVVYQLANGDFITTTGGDDVSMPGRIQETMDFLLKNPQVVSCHFGSLQVDESLKEIKTKNDEISKGLTSIITIGDYIYTNILFWLFSGDSRTFRREVIQKFPPLSVSHNEDYPMFMRCLIVGPTAIIRKPLVWHRMHQNNESEKLRFKQEGKDLFRQIGKDLDYAFDNKYLTEREYKALKRKVKKVHLGMMLIDITRLFPFVKKFYISLRSALVRISS